MNTRDAFRALHAAGFTTEDHHKDGHVIVRDPSGRVVWKVTHPRRRKGKDGGRLMEGQLRHVLAGGSCMGHRGAALHSPSRTGDANMEARRR